MSANVEVLEVTLLDLPEQISTLSIDLPRADDSYSHLELVVAGWALASPGLRATSVRVHCCEELLREGRIEILRQGVQDSYPDHPHARTSGFHLRFRALALPEAFTLVVSIAVESAGRESWFRVCQIGGVIVGKLGDGQDALNPLMLTGLGRSGTTWLMHLFDRHPEVLLASAYPYEQRHGAYWMHVLRVLSEPADHLHSSRPDDFALEARFVGHNPFDHIGMLDRVPQSNLLRDWLGGEAVDEVIGFCKRMTASTYRAIAECQSEESPRLFVEKLTPLPLQELYWRCYSDSREVFLVRDFRDVACSIRAFNAKRKKGAFGASLNEPMEQTLRRVAAGAERVLDASRRRSGKSLTVRYEDLVIEPVSVLASIFSYLGVACGEREIAHVLDPDHDDEYLEPHQTSENPASSIGRWKRDMSPGERDLARDLMEEQLTGFGYDP